MNNNILLVNPPLSNESTTSFFIMPLGIMAIASYLREKGENPTILDLNVVKRKSENDILEEFENQLKLIKPLIVGVSVMVVGQFKVARQVLKRTKEIYPDTITMLGGANSTQFPEDILNNCPEVDFVVLGEGEHQTYSCVKYARNNNDVKNWPDGIAFRSNSKIVNIPKKSFIKNIDDLPTPAYDLINFTDYKHDTSTWHNPFNIDFGVRVPIFTSRGCPNKCNFCSVDGCMGSRHRTMSSIKVVDMIQSLYEQYNTKCFAIFDANFSQDVSRVIDICNEIEKRNIKICLDLPTGIPINKSSREMIDALVSIGLIRTGISIESGDTYVRNEIMKKNVEEEDIFILIEDVRRHPHVHLLVDFVMGMPEDTKEGLETSCKLIEQIDVDSLALSVATPYPGTPLYKQCVEQNLFFDDINHKELWTGEWFTHANINKFIIKPPALDLETLQIYRDRIIKLRDKKVINYKKRMKELFNVDSKFEPERKKV